MESRRDTTKWLTLSLSLLYPTKIPLSSECSQWSQLRFVVYSLNWIPGWMRDRSREKGSEPCFLDHISVIWGNDPLTLLASHWDGDFHLGPLGMLMEALCGISGHLEDWNTCLALFSVSPGSTAAWICKTLQVLATYNHEVLYNMHLPLSSFALFGKCTRPSYNFRFKKQQPCKGIWGIAGQWQWYFKVQNLCDRHFVGVARYTLAELPACGDLKQENEEHMGLP